MKILNLEIATCKYCPYVRIHFGLSNFIKCDHKDAPVLNNAIKFTVDKNNLPVPLEIPDWCPLPNKN